MTEIDQRKDDERTLNAQTRKEKSLRLATVKLFSLHHFVFIFVTGWRVIEIQSR